MVSFDKKEKMLPEQAFVIGYKIAEYYRKDSQILFAVHENTNHLHIHFALNTVDYLNGKMYDNGIEDFNGLKSHIRNVLEYGYKN